MGAEEEEVQRERALEVGIGHGQRSNLITPSQFLSWKRRKDAEASARKAEAAQKRAEEIAAGTVQMNGRELFVHEPSVFDNTHY